MEYGEEGRSVEGEGGKGEKGGTPSLFDLTSSWRAETAGLEMAGQPQTECLHLGALRCLTGTDMSSGGSGGEPSILSDPHYVIGFHPALSLPSSPPPHLPDSLSGLTVTSRPRIR